MPAWFRLLVLLVVVAPNIGAQALLPPRFSSTASTVVDAFHASSPVPRICRSSKRAAVIRGAVGGFLTVGAVGFAVVFVRGISRVAAFQSGMQDFPLIELAATGAVLGAVLEGADWERECG